MSRETDDSEYRPKRRINPKKRTPGRTRQQVVSHNYLEYDSDGSSGVLEGSGEHNVTNVEYLSDSTASRSIDI